MIDPNKTMKLFADQDAEISRLLSEGKNLREALREMTQCAWSAGLKVNAILEHYGLDPVRAEPPVSGKQG